MEIKSARGGCRGGVSAETRGFNRSNRGCFFCDRISEEIVDLSGFVAAEGKSSQIVS
jgi:hypothetical protein